MSVKPILSQHDEQALKRALDLLADIRFDTAIAETENQLNLIEGQYYKCQAVLSDAVIDVFDNFIEDISYYSSSNSDSLESKFLYGKDKLIVIVKDAQLRMQMILADKQ